MSLNLADDSKTFVVAAVLPNHTPGTVMNWMPPCLTAAIVEISGAEMAVVCGRFYYVRDTQSVEGARYTRLPCRAVLFMV